MGIARKKKKKVKIKSASTGGGGAIANRYFLPLYPAFWFLATQPGRPRRVGAVFLLAAPFLWPLWTAPCAWM